MLKRQGILCIAIRKRSVAQGGRCRVVIDGKLIVRTTHARGKWLAQEDRLQNSRSLPVWSASSHSSSSLEREAT